MKERFVKALEEKIRSYVESIGVSNDNIIISFTPLVNSPVFQLYLFNRINKRFLDYYINSRDPSTQDEAEIIENRLESIKAALNIVLGQE